MALNSGPVLVLTWCYTHHYNMAHCNAHLTHATKSTTGLVGMGPFCSVSFNPLALFGGPTPSRTLSRHVGGGGAYQSVQQLQLQRGHSVAELGGVGARLLATFQQLKERGVHVEGLGGPCSETLKV